MSKQNIATEITDIIKVLITITDETFIISLYTFLLSCEYSLINITSNIIADHISVFVFPKILRELLTTIVITYAAKNAKIIQK